MTEELVFVGRVGRPHGLDGSFVVEHASEDPRRFAKGARLLVEGEPVEVVASKRVGGGRLAIRLDRHVERGAELTVPRAELPQLEQDEYYVFELVGLEVIEENGSVLGHVQDVQQYPANDVLELDSGLALPLVEDCVRQVDVPGGRIVVASGFTGDT
jgi:16S rRNA processing protein RimM